MGTRLLWRSVPCFVLISATLASCGSVDHKTEEKGNTTVMYEWTWEEAKEHAQQMELEIAGRVPQDRVVAIEQKPMGTLFSCPNGQYNWNGSTTVTVVEGTNIEPIVREIERSYAESRFSADVSETIDGHYRVQLRADDREVENYLFSRGFEPDQIRIASGSPCFTLPEGTSSMGEF